MLNRQQRKLLLLSTCTVVAMIHIVAFYRHGIGVWDDAKWMCSILLMYVLLYFRGRLGLGNSSDLASMGAYEEIPISVPFADFLAVFAGIVCAVKLV